MATNDIWDDIEAGLPAESMGEEMFEFISAYADGECSAKERRLVEAYLREREDARAVLADLRAQTSAMIADVEPPAWLASSILDRTTRKRKLWPAGFGLVGAAAAAGLAMWLLGPTSKPEVSPVNVVVNEASMPSAEPATTNVVLPPKGQPADKAVSRRSTFVQAFHTRADSNQPVPAPADTTPAQPASTGGKHVAMTYAVADSRPLIPEPTAPDTVSLVTGDDSEVAVSPPPVGASNSTEAGVSSDAREKLRDKLKKVNQDNKDIKEAVRVSTS